MIYRPELYNLQNRKKFEMVQTVQIEYYKVSKINYCLGLWTFRKYVTHFRDSTQTTYWLTKWLKKSLEQFADEMKKAKKVSKSWKWTSKRTILKALKYKSSLSFRASQKKIVGFTDSPNTIYWPTNLAKKAANCWNKSFYICHY